MNDNTEPLAPEHESLKERPIRAIVLFPIAWSVALPIFLSMLEVLFLSLRLVITLVTIVAMIVLRRSFVGRRRCLFAFPIWLILAVELFATWTHAIWTLEDWERKNRPPIITCTLPEREVTNL
jgi:hypothetical protein